MGNQIVKQLQVVDQTSLKSNQQTELVAFFDENGDPIVFPTDANTGDSILMTGYEIAGAAAAVANDDTVNEAMGKVEKRVQLLEAHDSAAEMVLTGFVTGSAVTAISATDTLNAALAKLQNRITALETP